MSLFDQYEDMLLESEAEDIIDDEEDEVEESVVDYEDEVEESVVDYEDEMSILEAMADIEINEKACKSESKKGVCEKCGKPLEKCECSKK